jgi:hypothetical protein
MDSFLNILIKEKPDNVIKFSKKYFNELYKNSLPDDESTLDFTNNDDNDDNNEYNPSKSIDINDLQQDSNLSNSMNNSMNALHKSPPKTAPDLNIYPQQSNNK